MDDVGGPAELRLPRARWFVLVTIVVVLPLLALVAIRYTRSAPTLPVSDERVTAPTPVGEAVYLGVFRPGPDFGRSIHLAGVHVSGASSVPVQITPLLCVGGSFSVTSDPRTFCRQVTDPEGHTFGGDDSIVLEVTGSAPGAVSIDRVQLAYREGIRWATQDAGSPSVVSLIAR